MKFKMPVIYILLALLAGALVPFQTGSNTTLTRGLGNGFYATLVVFLVAAIAMLAMIVIQQQGIPPAAKLRAIPWYGWVGGGLLGAVYIYLLICLAPRLGIASVTGFVVAGQLVTAVLFDHFGFMGFALHPINWQRLAGVLLLCAGLLLIKKY